MQKKINALNVFPVPDSDVQGDKIQALSMSHQVQKETAANVI